MSWIRYISTTWERDDEIYAMQFASHPNPLTNGLRIGYEYAWNPQRKRVCVFERKWDYIIVFWIITDQPCMFLMPTVSCWVRPSWEKWQGFSNAVRIVIPTSNLQSNLPGLLVLKDTLTSVSTIFIDVIGNLWRSLQKTQCFSMGALKLFQWENGLNYKLMKMVRSCVITNIN